MKHETEETCTSRFYLLGVPITATNMASAIRTVVSWIENGDRGRMVTFSTVHMLVEATKKPEFARLLQSSDMNCPDGMPLVWCGRKRGNKTIQRVCGPEFLPVFCAATAPRQFRHFFYGGAEGVAAKAVEKLRRTKPELQVAGIYTPPFRPLTPEEDEEVITYINSTNADLVWVCLGCPKQEVWITNHRHRLNASVLLAVGLALDIAAGSKQRAPWALRTLGLEWLFRLCQEPRRLWKRYLIYNSIFLYRLLSEEMQSPEGKL